MHGKNFFKIRADFLPDRDTADLIEFYYFWKKTVGAANNRPRGRRHRPSVMRRIKTGGAKGKDKTPKDDPNDLSSCSDGEQDDGEDDKKEGDEEPSPYYCRHCFTTQSRDWHHCCKERLLLCRDCRTHYKRYAELPNLEEPSKKFKQEQEEIKRKKEEEEEAERQRLKKLEELKALEEAKAKAAAAAAEGASKTSVPANAPPTGSLLTSQLQQPSFLAPPPAHQQRQSLPPSAHSSSSEIQVIGERPGLGGLLPSQQPPMIPREPSPPPKPDGSECHRSQSAIFTRMWNRGEGNSCSRTDMIFKPVPDSKLARKREERVRKANDREEAMKVAEHAKRIHHDLPAGHPGAVPPPGAPSHPLFSPTSTAAAAAAAAADPFRRFSAAGHPLPSEADLRLLTASPAAQRPMYPPGFGPAPPAPPSPHPHSLALAADARRMEEMVAARAAAERQAQQAYTDQMNAALATDPLVRLRMAGVTPEIPGASPFGPHGHSAYAGLMRPPPPPHGMLDPRFRPDLLRPGSYLPPGADMLQRQLLMEREQSLLHQQLAAQAHASELMRLEEEARARAARP